MITNIISKKDKLNASVLLLLIIINAENVSGSDIGGSIRMPAFFNGIFGHKPSRCVVSNAGQYPIPETELLNSFLGNTYLLYGNIVDK